MCAFEIATDVVRGCGQKLRTAADGASGPLRASRDEAVGARPGFPGEASALFDGAMSTLLSSETSVLSSVRNLANNVQNCCDSYDSTNQANGGRFQDIEGCVPE